MTDSDPHTDALRRLLGDDYKVTTDDQQLPDGRRELTTTVNTASGPPVSYASESWAENARVIAFHLGKAEDLKEAMSPAPARSSEPQPETTATTVMSRREIRVWLVAFVLLIAGLAYRGQVYDSSIKHDLRMQGYRIGELETSLHEVDSEVRKMSPWPSSNALQLKDIEMHLRHLRLIDRLDAE